MSDCLWLEVYVYLVTRLYPPLKSNFLHKTIFVSSLRHNLLAAGLLHDVVEPLDSSPRYCTEMQPESTAGVPDRSDVSGMVILGEWRVNTRSKGVVSAVWWACLLYKYASS